MVGESGSQLYIPGDLQDEGSGVPTQWTKLLLHQTNNRRDIHRIISQHLWRSPENHLDHHLWTWVQKFVEGTFQNNIFINKDNCSTKSGVLTTNSFWLIVAPHSSTQKSPYSSLHEHSLTMPPGIRPSILRSTAFYILFIELPKYQFSDPYQKFIHRSIHRTLQKINSSKHFFRTSIHQSFQKILFIDPFRPSIHLHRSILDHLSRRPFIHLSRRPFIDPARGPFIDPSRRRTHRSIQTTHSFLSWSDQHAFQSSLQMNHRQSRVRLHSMSQQIQKLSWIILYFITQKNVTISDRTCQTCNAFILWIGSYVIFSAPWCCPCI